MIETEVRSRFPHALLRPFRPMTEPPAGVSQPRVSSLVLCAWAVWFGLVGGLLELVALLARMTFSRTVTPDLLTLNHHFAWMILLSDTVMILALGLILCPWSGLRRIGAVGSRSSRSPWRRCCRPC